MKSTPIFPVNLLPKIVVWILILAIPCQVWAVEHLAIERDGSQQRVSGQAVVKAKDGGLLVMDSKQVLWTITPDEIVSRVSDEAPFERLDRKALADQLRNEMPSGFRVHETAHYLFVYNTSRAYAEWCGALFERLHMAFLNYWQKRGFDVNHPDWPLVALIFDSRRTFAAYSRPELGDATDSVIGYYSLRSNRVAAFDLTSATGSTRSGNRAMIRRLLQRPEAERRVATIIHEATHQLAFNCGLQTRYADIPKWVSEGIAIYFETPDLRSTRGWQNIGGINHYRNSEFRRTLSARKGDSLKTLLATDERFLNQRSASQAYAEAWALNYYLIRKHPDEYLKYMKLLSEKRPVRYDNPEDRLTQFRDAFSADLPEIDQQFLRYMRTVR